jgi:hypothetical protein
MQTIGATFDAPVSLPPGNHQLTLIEVDDIGFYAKSTSLNVTVDADDSWPCPAPGTPGVNICSPSGGCNDYYWTQILATGKGQTGPVARMEIWVTDPYYNPNYSVKIANFPGSVIDTNLVFTYVFSPATYTLEIWEVDSNGHALKADVLQYSGVC